MAAQYGGAGLVREISARRRELEEELIDSSPVYADLVKHMSRVYGERGRPEGLDQTQRVLLALSMAVHGGSASSIEWTMTRAINHGATEDQIRDAMDVALLNGGTFAVSNFRFALETLRERFEHPEPS